MDTEKLPNAPLQEVIFEARWGLQSDSTGKQMVDPEFSFALGKFQNLIKNEFPVKANKFPNEFPSQILAHQTMYQFWSDARKWPVVQIGPGIISVNDTDQNYIWRDYYNLIKNVLDNLLEAYDGSLTFTESSLRYIDTVRVKDYGFDNWEDFVDQNINFKFENKFKTRGPLRNFQFNQSFEINELGKLNVNLSSGKNKKNETLFIWQNGVSVKRKQTNPELLKWLDKAHQCTSSVFKELCKEKFYGSFTK